MSDSARHPSYTAGSHFSGGGVGLISTFGSFQVWLTPFNTLHHDVLAENKCRQGKTKRER